MKWLKQIALGLFALFSTLAAFGTGYEEWSRRRLARTLVPAGTLIDVGGHRLHLHCSGTGTPTVILEAGADPHASGAWFTIRPAVAEMTRVCAYDRAGYGWSESGPEPRDARTIAAELQRLLERASEPAPFVLVGHSLGGPLIRVFAHRYPDEVVGLVFVDSPHPEEEERRPPELSMDRPTMRIAEWGFRIAARTGVLRLVSSLDPPTGAPENFGAFAPRGMATLVREFDALDSILAQDQVAVLPRNLPLIVLTGGRSFAELPDGLRQRAESVRLETQRELGACAAEAQWT